MVEHAAKDEIMRPLLAVGVHHEETCTPEGKVRSLANAENSCSLLIQNSDPTRDKSRCVHALEAATGVFTRSVGLCTA